jgi:hypothetical protein
MTDGDRRRAALAAEHDPTLVGSALAATRRRYAWNRHDLARWLGLTLEQLDALALESLATLPLPAQACDALAGRYAANTRRLAMILVHNAARPGGSR